MAEQKAQDVSQTPPAQQTGPKPILFIILSAFNIVVVLAVGILLYLGKKKEDAKPTIDQVVAGEKESQAEDAAKQEDEFIGKLVPMETFLVNLGGSRGTKLAKVTLELEVNNSDVIGEIDRRKPQIRDIIIILLSSKDYEQVSTRDGKDALRDEIRDRVNSFLTKGKITKVYFTEFLLN